MCIAISPILSLSLYTVKTSMLHAAVWIETEKESPFLVRSRGGESSFLWITTATRNFRQTPSKLTYQRSRFKREIKSWVWRERPTQSTFLSIGLVEEPNCAAWTHGVRGERPPSLPEREREIERGSNSIEQQRGNGNILRRASPTNILSSIHLIN